MAVVLVRGWGGHSIYWCGYLVLWQAGPLNQRSGKHYTHTPGEEASARSDQPMQFPRATDIWDEDDYMWKGWRQHREEAENDRKKRVKPGGGTSSKGDKYILIRTMCITPFTRSKSRVFIFWRRSNINKKTRTRPSSRVTYQLKTQSWHSPADIYNDSSLKITDVYMLLKGYEKFAFSNEEK